MTALVLLVCYVVGSWAMPEGWEVTRVENRPESAAVYLQRRVPDGATIQVPVGCLTEEPKRPASTLQLDPGQLYLPYYAVPNALPNSR